MFDYIAQSELDGVNKEKWSRGDLVKFVVPTFSGVLTGDPIVGTRIARGVIRCEANGKPGFYYAWEEATKRAHLVYTDDLVRI